MKLDAGFRHRHNQAYIFYFNTTCTKPNAEDEMLEVLNDLAKSLTAVRSYQQDPQGFLKDYPDLSDDEYALLLEGDSEKISAYATGRIAASQTVIIIIGSLNSTNDTGDSASESYQADHQNFWAHVIERSEALAA